MVNNYCQKHQEQLPKEARKKYQNLSEEEKEQRWKKAWDRYQDLFEEEKKHQYHHECNKNLFDKQKQVEYMKNYYLTA